MNLKKASLSLLAGFAIASSMAMGALAEPAKTEVVDIGEITSPQFANWSGGGNQIGNPDGLVFPAANVDFDTGDTVVIDDKYITMSETRSHSPGWTVTMTASDLTTANGNHSIPASNLSVEFSRYGIQPYLTTNCPPPGESDVPDNPYLTLTGTGGTFGADAVTLLTASNGRGCGAIQGIYDFSLSVPGGTYTGVGERETFTGTVTLTLNQDVGEGGEEI